MNLYGDLPPAADGSSNTVQSKGSWSGLSVAAKPKTASIPSAVLAPRTVETKPALPSAPIPSSPKIEEQTVTAPSKFVPTKVSAALAFKPRQALQPSSFTRPLVAAPSPVAPSQAPLNQHIAVTRISKFSPPIAVEPRVEVEIHNEKEDTESFVNEVATFDVEDPYDPSKPNDYIKLLDEREEAKRLLELQRENQRVLEESERLREENAKQRLLAVQSGDYSSLLSSSINNRGSGLNPSNDHTEAIPSKLTSTDQPVGRGRGRGMINLPAWMTQKMEADAAAAAAAGATPASSVPTSTGTVKGQFEDITDNTNEKAVSSAPPVALNLTSIIGMKRKQGNFSKPSTIVLLKNMVPIGEVDGSLGEETKRECSKFGPVVRCVVHTLPEMDASTGIRYPDEERVRVFVVFGAQESAVKAYRDMNGRFFGGRKITASFFDEDRFTRNELTPINGE